MLKKLDSIKFLNNQRNFFFIVITGFFIERRLFQNYPDLFRTQIRSCRWWHDHNSIHTYMRIYRTKKERERERETRQRKRKNCTRRGVPSRIIPRKVKPSGWSKCVLLNYGHPLRVRAHNEKYFSAWDCVNAEWERRTRGFRLCVKA